MLDFASARTDVLRQLRLLGALDVVLSSNVPIRKDGLPAVPDREPMDPGVAVYFRREARAYVVACDQFERVRSNLRAIGMTLQALRSIERHGTTSMLEQAFSGFAQLPPARPAGPAWREVLALTGPVTADQVRARVRELAKSLHPDAGGNDEKMREVNLAATAALNELDGIK
jgi:hypothetical protein